MTAEYVHVIDDDDAVRDALAFLFRSVGHAVKTYASAEEFLEDGGESAIGTAIVDMRMGAISGLELHRRLKDKACALSVIFLTGHGDVPLAVDAIKNGAYDFLEKPFDDSELLRIVGESLAAGRIQRSHLQAEEARSQRLSSLSDREKQVLSLLVAGKPNKVIAAELNIAIRTVEVHRSRVLSKMGVKSLVELAAALAAKV